MGSFLNNSGSGGLRVRQAGVTGHPWCQVYTVLLAVAAANELWIRGSCVRQPRVPGLPLVPGLHGAGGTVASQTRGLSEGTERFSSKQRNHARLEHLGACALNGIAMRSAPLVPPVWLFHTPCSLAVLLAEG